MKSEAWLTVGEHLLLSQRTGVQVPAPTRWWLATVCNLRFQGCEIFFWSIRDQTRNIHTCMQANTQTYNIKINVLKVQIIQNDLRIILHFLDYLVKMSFPLFLVFVSSWECSQAWQLFGDLDVWHIGNSSIFYWNKLQQAHIYTFVLTARQDSTLAWPVSERSEGMSFNVLSGT